MHLIGYSLDLSQIWENIITLQRVVEHEFNVYSKRYGLCSLNYFIYNSFCLPSFWHAHCALLQSYNHCNNFRFIFTTSTYRTVLPSTRNTNKGKTQSHIQANKIYTTSIQGKEEPPKNTLVEETSLHATTIPKQNTENLLYRLILIFDNWGATWKESSGSGLENRN
jgi:hypothetical protein